jgi:hypothetical protein
MSAGIKKAINKRTNEAMAAIFSGNIARANFELKALRFGAAKTTSYAAEYAGAITRVETAIHSASLFLRA